MSGSSVIAYLKGICRKIDNGTLPKQFVKVAVATATPVSMLIGGCVYAEYGAPMYGVPYEDEICDDGIDNDYDGLVDCEDPMCSSIELCLGCDDGIDNDNNGLSDCRDETCQESEACTGSCDDDTDNDLDNLTDCQDPDCAGSATCP